MKSNLTDNWIVCRICLKQPKESMRTIFDKSDTKDMTLMILECGGVPIKKFDHYPDKICSECFNQLRVAHKFRVTCQRSHKHLSKFIAPVVVEKLENKVDYADAASVDSDLDDDDPELITNQDMEFKSEGTTDEADDEIKKELEEANDDDLEDEDDEDDLEGGADVDEAVVDVFVPLDEDLDVKLDEDDDFADMDTIDGDEIEYLDEFVDEFNSSDEEYAIKAKPGSKRTMTRRGPTTNKLQKPSTSRGASTATRGRRPAAITGGSLKRDNNNKPKKQKVVSFICDICGNKYPSQSRLTEHIKLHKGIKPHQCEICGHAFAQTQQLTRHMNTHTGNRPYKCNYCPAAFADLSTRNKHHRIHTNERPYVCDVCGKTFTYTNTLKFHKMIHTGEKPHVCEICGKGFQQSYKLRNHRQTHDRKASKQEKLEVQTMVSYQEVSTATAQILEL